MKTNVVAYVHLLATGIFEILEDTLNELKHDRLLRVICACFIS